ncbi:outer membrane assembly protein AsmA [Dickeya lacustris]|uniref:Outer membrane assembly protein AsmA n=1 Tax=Dickeya lacustris TaxID=2259638 RepID=A0ABY8G6H1_9GAMM|nr:outer membrane assembly protein AsmA [Dickeya lacustris]WFN55557.1 outer membrane assembly protein AsmA [Dickeya lacustris]
MRRLFTTLIILLVVLAAGMSALVLLINPNDFRAYMVRQVEARTGYKLTLDGELRWHVWPQLSILSDSLALSAPGAALPVVSAENMRLDVKLWPLLSHRLEVKQVMLKGAVIRLTPESEARIAGPVPIAPAKSSLPEPEGSWRFDINQLDVADSLLVFQRGNAPALNVRDIQFSMQRDTDRQVSVSLSSRVNRDQRDLQLTLHALLEMQNYPQQIAATIDNVSYQLQGAGLPAEGISGKGSLRGKYQRQPEKLTVSQFALSANNSQLSGALSATFENSPDYVLSLTSEKLDLDALLGWVKPSQHHANSDKPLVMPPVFSQEQAPASYQNIRDSIAQVSVVAKSMIYQGIVINQFSLEGHNWHGKMSIDTLSGQIGSGAFSLPGSINIDATPAITLQPTLTSMEMSSLLPLFGLPALDGKISLSGKLRGDELSRAALLSQWQGEAQVSFASLRLPGLNLQQLIQQAVARSTNNSAMPDTFTRYTDIQQMSAAATLDAGNLTLQSLSGRSQALTLEGEGDFDLSAQRCDIHVDIRPNETEGDSLVRQLLQDNAIPFRLYGQFDNLNYQFPIEQLLRKRLQDEVKKRLNDWSEKITPAPKAD